MSDNEEGDDMYGVSKYDYDRTGKGHRLSMGKGKFKDTQDMMNMTNPEERFLIVLETVLRENSSKLKIQDSELDSMIQKLSDHAQNDPNIRYRNPLCYILGYIVTNGGRSIDMAKFTMIVKNLKQFEGSNITEPDVIRYGRYWIANS